MCCKESERGRRVGVGMGVLLVWVVWIGLLGKVFFNRCYVSWGLYDLKELGIRRFGLRVR